MKGVGRRESVTHGECKSPHTPCGFTIIPAIRGPIKFWNNHLGKIKQGTVCHAERTEGSECNNIGVVEREGRVVVFASADVGIGTDSLAVAEGSGAMPPEVVPLMVSLNNLFNASVFTCIATFRHVNV